MTSIDLLRKLWMMSGWRYVLENSGIYKGSYHLYHFLQTAMQTQRSARLK